jgi:hypothetical protein
MNMVHAHATAILVCEPWLLRRRWLFSVAWSFPMVRGPDRSRANKLSRR